MTGRRGAEWGLWVRWVWASVLAGFVGLGMAAEIPWGVGVIPSGDPANEEGYSVGWAVALAGIAAGAVMGGIEWLFLRRWLSGGRWWIVGSILGFGVSFVLVWAMGGGIFGTEYGNHALPHAVDRGGIVGGILIAVAFSGAQWLMMGQQRRQMGLWAVGSIIGFVAGWLAVAIVGGPLHEALGPAAHLVGGAIFGMVFGVITGGVLLRAFGRSRERVPVVDVPPAPSPGGGG